MMPEMMSSGGSAASSAGRCPGRSASNISNTPYGEQERDRLFQTMIGQAHEQSCAENAADTESSHFNRMRRNCCKRKALRTNPEEETTCA